MKYRDKPITHFFLNPLHLDFKMVEMIENRPFVYASRLSLKSESRIRKVSFGKI